MYYQLSPIWIGAKNVTKKRYLGKPLISEELQTANKKYVSCNTIRLRSTEA